MQRNSCLLLIISTLATVTACSVDATSISPATGQTSASLLAAPADATNTWAVGICGTPLVQADGGATGDGTGTCQSWRCSGSLIAPNLVLTARHCVEDPSVSAPLSLCSDETANKFPSASPDPASFHVTTSTSGSIGAPVWRKAKAIYRPAGVNTCSDDIALIQLDSTVPSSEAKPAAPDLFTDVAASKPAAVAVVGRGAIALEWDVETGTPSVLDRGDALRRILEDIPFVCASATDGVCKITDYTTLTPPYVIPQNKGMLVIGKGIASGDSGSGVLDQTRFAGGVPAILGVVSYAEADAQGKQGNTSAPRLQLHRSFISEVAATAAAEGKYAIPAWVKAAPAVAAPPDGGTTEEPDGGGSSGETDGGTEEPEAPPSEPGDEGCSAGGSSGGFTWLTSLAVVAALALTRRRRLAPSGR